MLWLFGLMFSNPICEYWLQFIPRLPQAKIQQYALGIGDGFSFFATTVTAMTNIAKSLDQMFREHVHSNILLFSDANVFFFVKRVYGISH